LTTRPPLNSYLLAFDCVSFNRFLETLLASQNSIAAGGMLDKRDRSPWLFTTAADTIFTVAKNRVYVKKEIPSVVQDKGKGNISVDGQAIPDDLDEDEWGPGPTEEEEEMLRAMEQAEEVRQGREGASGSASAAPSVLTITSTSASAGAEGKGKEKVVEPEQASTGTWKTDWIPPGIEPVLEEQPKWLLLADVLDEIETDMHWAPVDVRESRASLPRLRHLRR
jgi:DNA excision repair protein ERCC-4